MKNKIKKWLEENNHTQIWLANEIGIDRANLSYYMVNREPGDWPTHLTVAIQRITGITLDDE